MADGEIVPTEFSIGNKLVWDGSILTIKDYVIRIGADGAKDTKDEVEKLEGPSKK